MEATQICGSVPELSGLRNSPCDLLGLGIVAVDSECRVCGLNAAAKALLRLDVGRLLQPRLEDLPAPLRQLVKETFKLGKGISQRYLELTHLDRGSSVVSATTEVLVNRHRKTTAVIAVLTDVLGGEKLNCDMERLNRLASIGTASVSLVHELRNAFVAVNTFVQKLLEKQQESELTPIVARELQRIDSLVRQMLTAARPTKAAETPTSVHQALSHALRLADPELTAKGIQVCCAFSAPFDRISGDSFQLEQAFYNLLANSIAALSFGGSLNVSTANLDSGPGAAAAGRALEITIADTGTGIAPADMNRLFAPFFTTKPEGTGLGLAITRRIIEEHRGQITVSSELGKGTTIRIVLPNVAFPA